MVIFSASEIPKGRILMNSFDFRHPYGLSKTFVENQKKAEYERLHTFPLSFKQLLKIFQKVSKKELLLLDTSTLKCAGYISDVYKTRNGKVVKIEFSDTTKKYISNWERIIMNEIKNSITCSASGFQFEFIENRPLSLGEIFRDRKEVKP